MVAIYEPRGMARELTSEGVHTRLVELLLTRGIPAHTRSYNGPEFVTERVWGWLQRLALGPLYIEPFSGKLRDKLLRGETSDTLLEAHLLVERWRKHDNQVRPHSALGCRPPAPEAKLLAVSGRSLSFLGPPGA